jgi:hypothetical protein
MIQFSIYRIMTKLKQMPSHEGLELGKPQLCNVNNKRQGRTTDRVDEGGKQL